MKEFINKHPILTTIMVFAVCDAVVNCVKMIVTGEAPAPGVQIKVESTGDTEGAK